MKKTVALLLGMRFAVLLWVLESQRRIAAQNENQNESAVDRESSVDRAIDNQAHHFLAQGKQIFRFDTFGDEAFFLVLQYGAAASVVRLPDAAGSL